jgi:putative restriction endonuclease
VAQIIANSDGSQWWVSNDLSLCRLHHGAFDRDMLSFKPDFEVQIPPRVLPVKDGPVHAHGLLDLHGRSLREVPGEESSKPDSTGLESRFVRFCAA